MGTVKDSEKTRARIIDAAGHLFAEQGFKGVTVRDIAKQADTHLSALNYHFKSKEALYRDVLLEACRSSAISLEDQKQLLRLEPNTALYILISEALKTYRQQNETNWQMALITRESRTPSHVFTEVVEEYFKPEINFIALLVGKIVNRPADDHQVRFAVFSLIGLLETFGLYEHLIEAVAPGLTDQLKERNLLAKTLSHMAIEVAQAPKQ